MGNPTDLFLSGSNAVAFLLCVSFIAYVLLIVVPFLKRKPSVPGDGRGFSWHFIVPCLNEEAVIEQTLIALVTDFPSAHVWCVDDASSDGTAGLLARTAARCDRVHVVTRRLPRARQGKGPALNAGWLAIRSALPPSVDSSRVIVGVLDADGSLDRRCLDYVAGPSFFAKPDVGAVQVSVHVVNNPNHRVGRMARLLVRLQDLEFTGVIAAMQVLRRHVGSVGMGGNGQFTRLSVLDHLAAENGTPWQNALIEDFELGLHVLLAGSRTEYCHDTFVEQQGPRSLRRLIRQRSRWAQGLMQCFKYLRPVLSSPRITNTAAIEISYFILLPWVQLFGGLFLAVSTAAIIWLALTLPAGFSTWFGAIGWGLVALFLLFALGPLVVWGPVYRKTRTRAISRTGAMALGLAYWPYTYVHHVATWWAFARVLRSRHDWKKTERERDPAFRTGPTPSRPTVAVPLAASPDGGHRSPPQPVHPRLVGSPQQPTADDWEQAIGYVAIPRQSRRTRQGSAARRAGVGNVGSRPAAPRRS